MTSPREKYLAMLRAGLPKVIEEAKARHPQMDDLLKFLLGHVEGLGLKNDDSDQKDLEVAERRLPVGLNGLWDAINLAATKGARDDDEFARNIQTVAMCSFIIGSRASISNNSRKYVSSKQAQGGQAANSERAERRYKAFKQEIGPDLTPGEEAKVALRRIEERAATDPSFAKAVGKPSLRTVNRLLDRYRLEREH